MTDIICRWLNEDLELSSCVEKENVSKLFSSGYLFGEVLYKYGLQDDFSSFSKGKTTDSKLNNFTRIEPVVKLLEIPYDTNVAKSIMTENHGAATKLLYQLFIALGRKAKKNLTGVAMETMRASAPVKLENIESAMHKERLKQLVPRQVDVNFETLIERYQNRQKLQEHQAAKAQEEDEMKIKKYQQDLRQKALEKSRLARDKQNEVMQKIRDAQVRIPKAPESKKLGKTKQEIRKETEIQEVQDQINSFEESLKTNLPPQTSVQFESELEDTLEFKVLRKPLQPIALKTSGDEYVSKVKQRLNEDALARKEREKRRRRVLVEQLKAHEAQEEQRREEMLVKRLMRQSQQEKRIAVQLMQIRHEKQVIKENRIFREKQYAERRLKDFQDALNREAEMCRLAQVEYREQIEKAVEERKILLEEKRKSKYEKHKMICRQILSDIVDFSCKIGEYRELTEGNVPEKLFREWKGYFGAALPLYEKETLNEEEIHKSKEVVIEEEKKKWIDESDFVEYRGAIGEWQPSEDTDTGVQIPPRDNPILGHIIQKLFNIISPPEPAQPIPEFPPFPVKACFLGKFFSGKTTAVQRLVATHRLVRLCIDDLVQQAVKAHEAREVVEEIVENMEPQNETENEVAIEETKISELPQEHTKENQDPNDATVPESASVIDDNEGNGYETAEKKRSFYTVKKITSRAMLGEKAFGYLRKGKQIPDQLLVDICVDAIRQVPSGTGWILDGFPLTISQAKILEKALTGYDASKEVKAREVRGKGKKSRIAPDPHPAAPSPPFKSGIDIVVLFDVSDDVILRRAEGRTYNPTNNEIYHQEYNPPVEGSYTGLGKQEKILAVNDPSNDREQMQQRIAGFDDTWSKLEKWFNKFEILTKVDVNNSIDDAYEHVRSLLVATTEKIERALEEKAKEEVTDVELEVTNATPECPPDDKTTEMKPTDTMQHEDVEDLVEPKAVSPKTSKKISPPRKRDTVSPKASKKTLTAASKKASPSLSRKSSKMKSPTLSRSDTKRAKSAVKMKQEVQEELPVEPVVPSGPEPGSKEWEYVDQPIDMPLVTVLADRWENLEKTYIETSKNVFREIRQERELIYRYFYRTRKEFLAFLRRPDEKGEYVLQWQSHYNDVAEDMRTDDEVKAELHQEVDDLCDRLYEICDNRKEMAENERKLVMKEGWLQDRLGLLTNHYITLMQTEVDRYQDTYRLLKDYYNSAQGKHPIEAYSELCRIPLVDLPPIIPSVPSSASEGGSHDEVKQTLSKKDRETLKTPEAHTSEGEEQRSRIPLVPRRPKSGDITSTKEKKDKRTSKEKRDKADNQSETPVLPSDPDERLVFDGYYAAVAIIDTLATLDHAEQEVEAASKMAEAIREKEKEKDKDASKKGGVKDKKAEKKGKKSASKTGANSKQLETPPPAPPSNEENEEEKLKQEIKEKARREFLGAVQSEDTALRTRLEMIRSRSVAVLQDLKTKAESTYRDMDDWLGARFLQEVESIRAMAKLARTAVENEQKLQQQVILEDKDFLVDWDVKLFRTPSPTPPPSPKEQTSRDYFTVVQLEHLYKQFVQAAPSALISGRAFVDIFLDLMTTSFGMEMLPDMWINQTGVQLHSLTTHISQDSEFVDWKRFLVLASKPLPLPSRLEILETLAKFKNIDVEGTGFVSEEQFSKLQLWFSEDEKDNALVYPRVRHLKQLLFQIFSDPNKNPLMLNYEDFLLYFAMDENSVEGIFRALTVVCGQNMPSASICQPAQLDETRMTAKNIADEPNMNAFITLRDLVKVFHHGGNEFSEKQRLQGAEHIIRPFSKDRLRGVFMELGAATETEPLPFYVLYQHPIIEDCIQICQRFKYCNLQTLLRRGKLEGSANGQ